MEDTWEDVLEVVRQHSIDTQKDTLLKEWSGLVESTRRIVDRVLRISDRFHVASPDGEDPELDKSEDELYFSAGEHGDLIDDTLGAGKVTIDINGACQWTGAAEDDVTDAEFHADGDEVRHVTTEVIQSGTGLKRGVPETTLEDLWNCNTHPEPAIVPEGSIKSRRLVLDMSRRSSYLEIDRIKTFLDRHKGTEVTRSELEELDDLERALIRQWRYVRRLASEDRETLLETLSGPDNLVSALGLAVGDALRSSKQFIREATTDKVNAQATDKTYQDAPPTKTSQKTTGKQERLDHTLRPHRHLSRTMSLEEATKWLKNFESYLVWNESVIAKRNACSRDLLESRLEADLVLTLQTDETVTMNTTVRGRTAGRLGCWQSYGDTSSARGYSRRPHENWRRRPRNKWTFT
jgi:hypothetical protein